MSAMFVDVLISELIAIAKSRGVAIAEQLFEFSAPPKSREALAEGADLSDSGPLEKSLVPNSTDLATASIDLAVRYVLIGGHHNVLLGDLGDNASLAMVRQKLRAYHWCAASARSRLAGWQKDDLSLFLVGPAGSEQQADWLIAAGFVERDERICRKLVWLPPLDETGTVASVSRFLARTFLARPWEGEDGAPAQELDTGARLQRALEKEEGLAKDEAATFRQWWAILSEKIDDADPEALN